MGNLRGLMLWSLILLGIIILGLGASVFIMASRTKPSNTIVSIDGIDLSDLIDRLAKAIGKEIAEQLQNKAIISRQQYDGKSAILSDPDISMDDSIIPMKVDTSQLEGNLENMSKEEIQVDKDIEKNKSKLASIMKGRKK